MVFRPHSRKAHGAVVAGFFASSVPESLGVHLRSTGHSQPIRSGVVFDGTNQGRLYKTALRWLKKSIFFNGVHRVESTDFVKGTK